LKSNFAKSSEFSHTLFNVVVVVVVVVVIVVVVVVVVVVFVQIVVVLWSSDCNQTTTQTSGQVRLR
jgi:hypothetical protein